MDLFTDEAADEPRRLLRSEDRLLLDEAHHRTANEVASALAALRLAAAASGPRARKALLAGAIRRLEGFGRMHQLMGAPVPRITDLAGAIEDVVAAIVSGRVAERRARIKLSLAPVRIDGETARILSLIAYELVLNGIKYALHEEGGEMQVDVVRSGGVVVLTVRDFGPGIDGRMPRGTGFGTRLVSELVARRGGLMECVTGAGGTTVRVALPARPRRPATRRFARE